MRRTDKGDRCERTAMTNRQRAASANQIGAVDAFTRPSPAREPDEEQQQVPDHGRESRAMTYSTVYYLMMTDRAPTVVNVTMGEKVIGIMAPLPASLSRDELMTALKDLAARSSDFDVWLTERLNKTTGRRYVARTDPRTWESGGQSQILYEGVRITEESSS
jgi:hypothetical protein